MAKKPAKGKGGSGGDDGPIVHLPLAFTAGEQGESTFKRADLIFENVPHNAGSYEIRVFLNNKKAHEGTKRTGRNGYAGRFRVFGHGGCFGAEGHCDTALAERMPAPDALTGRRHPLAPYTRMLTVTKPLQKLLEKKKGQLESLTLVPIAHTPLRAERGLLAGVADRLKVSLRTYR